MPLATEKKKFIKEAGLSDDVIERLEANLKQLNGAASDAGLQSKEADDAEPEEDEAEDETEDTEESGDLEDAEETEVVAVVQAKEAAKKDDAAAMDDSKKKPRKRAPAKSKEYVTRDEVADVIVEVAAPLIQGSQQLGQLIAELTKEVKTLKKEITALKRSDEEKVAVTKELTPTLSLSEIISQNLVGKEAARVKGNTALGKEGPKETAAPALSDATMVPLINNLIGQSQTLRQ